MSNVGSIYYLISILRMSINFSYHETAINIHIKYSNRIFRNVDYNTRKSDRAVTSGLANQ